MEDLILRPNESIILQPGERIEAVDKPLRIRVGRVNEGTNAFKNAEQMIWETVKRMSGNQTAVYRRGEETRLLFVVPETPNPDSFPFENQSLATTIRIFKTGKTDLHGWLPKDGDTLTYQDKTYVFKKTGATPSFYQDIGNYGVMIRLFLQEYRS